MELMLKSEKVLAIGAHPDDIEYGCFGALSYTTNPHILVLSRGESGGDPIVRTSEANETARLVDGNLTLLDFPDTRIEVPGIVADIEKVVKETAPGLVFTMSEDDTHQDHQAVARATQIALRRFEGLVLSYGTPSSFDKFSPQTIIGLSEMSMNLKLKALALHASQGHRQYMQPDYVRSIARYWAAMSRVDIEYGEAFKVIRWHSRTF
jgi:LmbE family N-acetylglucosaminyl deacetylase